MVSSLLFYGVLVACLTTWQLPHVQSASCVNALTCNSTGLFKFGGCCSENEFTTYGPGNGCPAPDICPDSLPASCCCDTQSKPCSAGPPPSRTNAPPPTNTPIPTPSISPESGCAEQQMALCNSASLIPQPGCCDPTFKSCRTYPSSCNVECATGSVKTCCKTANSSCPTPSPTPKPPPPPVAPPPPSSGDTCFEAGSTECEEMFDPYPACCSDFCNVYKHNQDGSQCVIKQSECEKAKKPDLFCCPGPPTDECPSIVKKPISVAAIVPVVSVCGTLLGFVTVGMGYIIASFRLRSSKAQIVEDTKAELRSEGAEVGDIEEIAKVVMAPWDFFSIHVNKGVNGESQGIWHERFENKRAAVLAHVLLEVEPECLSSWRTASKEEKRNLANQVRSTIRHLHDDTLKGLKRSDRDPLDMFEGGCGGALKNVLCCGGGVRKDYVP